MSRLLAADCIATAAHRFEHIAVTDCRHLNAAAERRDCLVESDVRHHRCHDGLMRQMPRAHHLRRTDNENVVAVNQVPCLINTETAIRITVVGYPDICPILVHSSAQRVKMRRAAAIVDVHPIRKRMNHLDVGTEAAQYLRHRLIGCTVCTVENNLHAIKPLRTCTQYIVDVLIQKIVAVLYHADILSRRACLMIAVLQLADKSLQLILYGIGQLVAVTAKELDAVIGERIVGCRDHNARVHLMLTCEIGNRRRRYDPCEKGNPPCRADPRCQCCLEHLARDTRISADQNARAHLGMCPEIERRRASEMICQLRCKLCICDTTHAVRSKKSHNNSLLYIFSIICCASDCADPRTVTFPLSSP